MIVFTVNWKWYRLSTSSVSSFIFCNAHIITLDYALSVWGNLLFVSHSSLPTKALMSLENKLDINCWFLFSKKSYDQNSELIFLYYNIIEVWREFVWGAVAGAFGEGMMHPVDTIKTRIQSQAILNGVKV